MKYRILLVILVLLLVGCKAHSQSVYYLDGATVITGGYDQAIKNQVVVVRNGKIVGVGTKNQVIIPDGAERIDATGRYIIPGLVDCHSHAKSPRDLALMLAWGVTSTNVMFESTSEAKSIEAWTAKDSAIAPQVYITAPIFSTVGGWWHGENFPSDSSINTFPATPEEANSAVRAAKAQGSPRIKIMYDDMTWSRDPLPPLKQMSSGVMEALVQEAKGQGLMSTAHAPKLADAKLFIQSGGTALVHGIIDERLPSDFIDIFSNRFNFYVPTFSLYEFLADTKGFLDQALNDEQFRNSLPEDLLQLYADSGYYQRYRERYPNIEYVSSHLGVLYDNVKTLTDYRMLIPLGTDMWALPGISLHLELEYLVRAGMTPIQALASASSIATQFLGIFPRVGLISEGNRADMLVLDADPLADIRNTRKIAMIIKHGKIFNHNDLVTEAKRRSR